MSSLFLSPHKLTISTFDLPLSSPVSFSDSGESESHTSPSRSLPGCFPLPCPFSQAQASQVPIHSGSLGTEATFLPNSQETRGAQSLGAGPKQSPPEPCLPSQGSHCSSSGDPAEYNLRSRTVLCGTCGQPADKAAGGSGAQVGGSISSGSSASSVTVTRSYRSVGGSGGGSFGDSLVTRSYLLGNSRPRTQVSLLLASSPTAGHCSPSSRAGQATGVGPSSSQPLWHPAPPV